jgi:hypothetical protein
MHGEVIAFWSSPILPCASRMPDKSADGSKENESCTSCLTKANSPTLSQGNTLKNGEPICLMKSAGAISKVLLPSAKPRGTARYPAVSGWFWVKNPNYTQSERRHELFETFSRKPPTCLNSEETAGQDRNCTSRKPIRIAQSNRRVRAAQYSMNNLFKRSGRPSARNLAVHRDCLWLRHSRD